MKHRKKRGRTLKIARRVVHERNAQRNLLAKTHIQINPGREIHQRNEAIQQIRDLKVVLKDFEGMIKNPHFLRVGRPIKNFRLLPREAWANWLLCVVGNFQNGNDQLTFSEDPSGGDGVILNKRSREFMLTEHVFIPEPRTGDAKTVEDYMIMALEHKVKKGENYAKGKHLIIFSEAIGWWYPNRVAKRIVGAHSFSSVWAVALQSGDENGYYYSVAQLVIDNANAPSWRVEIPFDFSDYGVIRVQ
jgi:hypothetical protein